MLNFLESRICELRLVPTPMGENFSGSSIVTSRNYLIHIGATTATKLPRFRRWRTAPGSIVKGLKPRRRVACYRELPRIHLLGTWVNKGHEEEGPALLCPGPSYLSRLSQQCYVLSGGASSPCHSIRRRRSSISRCSSSISRRCSSC